MGAIVKELKEKIVAAGGDTTGVQTVSEALDKLPASGGSGGIFMINFTVDDGYIISDKTAREIINATEAGMMVFGNYKYEDPDYEGEFSIDTLILTGYSNDSIEIRDLIYNMTLNGQYENLDSYPAFSLH